MSISNEQVKKIAKLARIKVSEEDVNFFGGELNKILNWIEQLQEVDTDGVQPMVGMEAVQLPVREDKVTDGGIAEEVLKNAKHKYGCFVVPKVVE